MMFCHTSTGPVCLCVYGLVGLASMGATQWPSVCVYPAPLADRAWGSVHVGRTRWLALWGACPGKQALGVYAMCS